MSSLPPLSSNGVFSVSASCTVDAPLEKVWSILLDFPSYKKWQEFKAYFLLARSELVSLLLGTRLCMRMHLFRNEPSLILLIDAVKLL